MIELYGAQQTHSENLLRSLNENGTAIDKGKTGTGKTYCASWVAKESGSPVGVICPVAVIPVWQRTLALTGVEPRFVVGYEKLRMNGTPYGKFNLKRWEWDDSLPKNTLFIFDEAHRLKGKDTLNARIGASAKQYRSMLLSATLAKDPTEMRVLGFLTGLHTWTNHYKWCLRTGCWKAPFGGLKFKASSAEHYLLKLNEYLFPRYGGGLRREDLGDLFKKNTIVAEAYDLNDGGKIQAAYEAMERELSAVVAQAEDAIDLQRLTQGVYMSTRQRVEQLKIPAFVGMTKDLVEEGNSVVIGTNFRATLEQLCEQLKCPGIYGGQNADVRENIIQSFQQDKVHVLVVNIQAGGQGISLHDTLGVRPRVSLISPPESPVDLIQFLGRIDRAQMQSDTLQKLIFAAGTVEEVICERVQRNANQIELLVDGDLALDFSGKRISTRSQNKTCEVTGTRLTSRRDTIPPEPVATMPANMETDNAITTPSVPVNAPSETPTTTALIASPDGGAAGDTVLPLVHSTRKHARLSPSTLRYKAICPGFFNDPDSDKSHADRGSLGHLAVEKEDLSLCGEDAVLRAAASQCIDYKHKIIALAKKPVVYQEIQLDYFDQFGFTDVIVLDIFGDVWSADLLDWKFAFNLHKANSPQFQAYCIGIWNRWVEVDEIRVRTVHPFISKVDYEVFHRTKHYSLFSGEVAAVMAKSDKNDPNDYRLSENCAYCGFAGRCVKLANMGAELADRYAGMVIELPNGPLHGSEITDPDVFAGLLRAAPIVEKAAEGWKRAANKLWNDGTEIPGYTMIKTGGRRSVVSAKLAFDLLKEHFVPNLTEHQFMDYCSVNPSALDDIVAAAAPPRGKTRAKELLAAQMEDADLLTTGAGGSYLKAVKKH